MSCNGVKQETHVYMVVFGLSTIIIMMIRTLISFIALTNILLNSYLGIRHTEKILHGLSHLTL